MTGYEGLYQWFPDNEIQLFDTDDPLEGGIDGTDNVPLKAIKQALNFVRDQFVGAVVAFTLEDPPAGFLKCNGARVLQADYPRLYEKMGYRFGQRVRIVTAGTVFTSISHEDGTGATTVAHGFATGDRMKLTELSPDGQFILEMPNGTPVDSSDDYYVKVLSSTTFSLHPTSGDATSGANVAECILYDGNDTNVIIEYHNKFSLPDMRFSQVLGHDEDSEYSTEVYLGMSFPSNQDLVGPELGIRNVVLNHFIKYE